MGGLNVFRKKCLFLLWTPNEHHFEIVTSDEKLWEIMKVSLERFYLCCLLPEIANPQVPRGLPVKDPDFVNVPVYNNIYSYHI